MGRRVGAALLGLAGVMAASTASALGLGEITLKSTLDQPLDAQVKLLEVRDLSKAEVIVGLASPEAYERQGVERAFFLTDINYDVVLEGAEGPYVRLTSTRPVREPFLNFILEARWPTGKLLREYTVLLDLPVFSDETAAPVNPVQTETVNQQPVRTQASTSAGVKRSQDSQYNPRSSYEQGTSSPASSRSRSYTPSHSGDEYGVQQSDTLWEIALSVRPDRSVSVHQTMMALHRANPEAFINGNINLLKAGKVLRVPDAEEIRSLNQQQAIQEVAQHNAEWRGGDSAAPLDASTAAYDRTESSARGEGRLSLASPDDSYDAAEGRVSGSSASGDSDTDALELELNATQETLDKTSGENRELRSKIGSLEEQIQTLESMLEVSNDSLRAMELTAASELDTDAVLEGAELETAAETDELEASVSDLYADDEVDSVLSGDDELSEDVVDEESIEGGADESASSEELVEEKPEPAKVVRQAPVEPSFVDALKENVLFIALGALALLAFILFFLKQRNKDDEGDDFDAFMHSDPVSEEEDIADLNDDGFDEDLGDLDEVDEVPEEELIAEDDHPEPETEDVVAESDIYIAYGKYDQAEEMLLKALSRDANHHEARLKLLEVYAAQGNIDRFDPNYASLRESSAPDALISRAAALREGIAGAGEFDSSLHSTGEFDVVEPALSEHAASEVSEPDISGSESLGFDLGDEGLDESSADDEADDSFDLDLGGSDEDLELSVESASDDLALELESIDAPEIELSSDSELDSLELDLGDIDSDVSAEPPAENASGDIEFDLEGLDFDDGSDDGDTELEPASGIELATSIDDLDLGSSDDGDSNDDIEFDLEGLGDLELEGIDDGDEIELELDLGEVSAEETIVRNDELELEPESDSGDDIEFDLGDLSLEAESEELGSLAEELDLEVGIEEDSVELSLASDDDDTVVTDAVDDTTEELEPAPTQFDMAALDEELDAMTSDFGDDLNIEETLDLEGADDLESATEKTSDLGADLEADLADLPDLDDVDAQAELDATIAEGEDILAELDAGVAEPIVEEPDLSFDEDVTIPRAMESMAEPEIGFDEPEAPKAEVPAESKSETLDFDLPDIDPDSGDDGDLDFLSDSDETATKLDLAAAYIDMGDMTGAKEIIDEVLKEGSSDQQSDAKKLLDKIGN